MSRRAELLAGRIEQGAAGLAAFAEGLSDAEWGTPVSATDPRTRLWLADGHLPAEQVR
jgi:hypothetical protein